MPLFKLGGGSGSGVSSVGLTAGTSIFAVIGSPVTSSGDLGLELIDQAANRFLAGPESGAAAEPSFRSIVPADLPLEEGTNITFTVGTAIVISATGGGGGGGAATDITYDNSVSELAAGNVQEAVDELKEFVDVLAEAIGVDTDSQNFVFASEGDTNGLVYYLGTNFGEAPFSNPHTSGVVTCIRSTNSQGTPATLVDRTSGINTHTDSVANSWVGIDIGEGRTISVSTYTLQVRGMFGGSYPSNWVLQGSNDVASNTVGAWDLATWTDLDTRVADTQMSSPDAFGTYHLSSASLPYRFFRIVTGLSSSGDNYNTIAEIELYGEFVSINSGETPSGASLVSYDPPSGVTADNVQDALDEIFDEIGTGGDPTGLGYVQFWYGPDSKVLNSVGAIAADGDPVYYVSDLSPHGRNLYQTNSSIRPVYAAAMPSKSVAAIRFRSGFLDRLVTQNTSLRGTGIVSDFTLFAARQCNGTGGLQAFFAYDYSNASTRFAWYTYPDGSGEDFAINFAGTLVRYTGYTPNTSFELFEVTHRSGAIEVKINNVSVYSNSYSIVQAGAVDVPLTVGAYVTDTPPSGDFYLGELVLLDGSATSGQVDAIRTEILTRWSV